MSNVSMGTTLSMGLQTEDDLSKVEKKETSSNSLRIDIQQLGHSIENAINLTDSPNSEIWHECVSCRDDHLQDEMIKTKCSHFYCKACLVRLFKNALRDESLFLPQCCKKPIAASEKILGSTLVQKHMEGRSDSTIQTKPTVLIQSALNISHKAHT
jgi:hypothetical protein